MEKPQFVKLAVIVSIVLIGLVMYSSRLQELAQSGAVITSTTGRECDDTDNNRINGVPTNELEDTDSIFTKGGVRIRSSNREGWSIPIFDSCVGGILTEKYCNSNGQIAEEQVTCEGGCYSGGACKLPSCTDSDGGVYNYTVAGTVSGLMLTDLDALGVPPRVQSAKLYSDKCVSDDQLAEHYCFGSGFRVEARQRLFNCSSLGYEYKCLEGACKK